jgi:hypothetical protein
MVFTGETARGLELAAEGMAIAREIGNPTAVGYAAYARGELLLESDPDESLRSLEEASAALSPVDGRFLLGVARVSLVSAAGRTSDPGRAVPGYLELLAHWASSGNRPILWVTMRNAAELLSRAGEDAAFATILGATRTADMLPAADSAESGRLAAALDRARSRLGETETDALLAAGEAMNGDAVLTLVRDALGRLSSS